MVSDASEEPQRQPNRKPRTSAMEVTAIGLGCYWFGFLDEDGEEADFHPETHLQSVKEALEGVDNISNVEVGGNTRYSSYSWIEDGDDGEEVIPLFRDAFISFDIFMPERLKEKYSFGRGVGSNTEYFQVFILYERGLPVTYITYEIDVTKAKLREHSPSSAVVFVREYLQEKLQDHKKVTFNIVGPSPFHADFFLTGATSGKEDEVEDLTLVGDGYHTILCKVRAEEDLVFPKFISRYNDCISTFYSTVRYKNASLRCRGKILKGMDRLSNINSLGEHRKRLGINQQGELIDELLNTIIRDKMNRVRLDRYISQQKEDGFINESDLFYKFIESKAGEIYDLPLEDIKQLLNMLEERRQRRLSNRAVVLSGLLGGFVGAVFGSALTFLLSTNLVVLAPPESQASASQAPPAAAPAQDDADK